LSRVREVAAEAATDDPAHDVEHLLRVARMTLELGGTSVEPDEAIYAALLHDVVNLPKDHPERHRASERSAARARALLTELGLPPERVGRIAEAIEDHSFSHGSRPRSPLGAALQDADRLEALGALGIARTFSTGVRLGARYFDPEDPWAKARPLDDRRYSVDHFFTKLLGLPATLCTAAGRRHAARRVRLLQRFLSALGDELGCPLDERPRRRAQRG
jgi:uncharacterized protein